jgi:hypothetical protein
MFKACQYATNDDKVVTSLKHVNVKNAQANLQKTITWTKKKRKKGEAKMEACVDSGM